MRLCGTRPGTWIAVDIILRIVILDDFYEKASIQRGCLVFYDIIQGLFSYGIRSRMGYECAGGNSRWVDSTNVDYYDLQSPQRLVLNIRTAALLSSESTSVHT